jgi:integrase
MHKFRHSYGSRLIDAGATIIYTASQMGDTPATVNQVYIHQLQRRENRKQAKILDEVFG